MRKPQWRGALLVPVVDKVGRVHKNSELRLSGQRKTEYRNLSLSSNILSGCLIRIWQVERLAVLTAINFSLFPPGFFNISTSLFDHVIGVKPPLQMSTAELSFFVLLITRTLIELLDLYFVFGKLRNLRHGAGRSGQRVDLVAGLVVPDSPADLHSTRHFPDKKAGVLGTPVSSVIGWFARIELFACVERALLPALLTA